MSDSIQPPFTRVARGQDDRTKGVPAAFRALDAD